MLHMKIIYSPEYNIDIGAHVFPTVKYDLIYRKLISRFKELIVAPVSATDEQVALVHTEKYISKLRRGSLSAAEIHKMELPYSRELVDASFLCAGGTIMACRDAILSGCSVHLGGGFHHAMPDHGEGFCVINDIGVGIRVVQDEGYVKKVLVIDCDLHQGNGTAVIFKDDDTVFTYSIHQENNYPIPKSNGSMDVGLADDTGDNEYMLKLKNTIPKIIDDFRPGLIVYVAGADPYQYDKLGGLKLTMEGLKKRDRFVFDLKIPTVAVLAGGYALNVEDTAGIHYNMAMEAIKYESKRKV